MQVEKKGATLGSRVFERLRAEIVNGELPPGQRLSPSVLASTYEVSLNVVREALNRLAGERLIDVQPNFGFSVRSLSAEDLTDLVQQRITLESIALRNAIALSTLRWRSEVLAAHHRLHETPLTIKGTPRRLNPDWIARHDEYHSATLAACGSPRLFQIVKNLAEAAEIYHRALLPVVSRDADMESEHSDLLKHILASDADRAIKVLTAHLEKTRDVMLPLLLRSDAEKASSKTTSSTAA